MRSPGRRNRGRLSGLKPSRQNDCRPSAVERRLKEATMAVEATSSAQLGHGGEPIVRDRLFIGGQWVEPAGRGSIEVIDSTTEEVMGSVPEGTPEDVDRAVAAARDAFETWSQASLADRADACRAIGAALAARSEELGALISREV